MKSTSFPLIVNQFSAVLTTLISRYKLATCFTENWKLIVVTRSALVSSKCIKNHLAAIPQAYSWINGVGPQEGKGRREGGWGKGKKEKGRKKGRGKGRGGEGNAEKTKREDGKGRGKGKGKGAEGEGRFLPRLKKILGMALATE